MGGNRLFFSFVKAFMNKMNVYLVVLCVCVFPDNCNVVESKVAQRESCVCVCPRRLPGRSHCGLLTWWKCCVFKDAGKEDTTVS